MSIKEVLTILSIFFMIAPSHAKIMTGKVIDKETNEPIEGVAVFLLKDSTKATFTDKKGVFFIDLPDQTDQIKINAFGYKILQTTISDNSVFKLEIDTYTFDDIVVTATENAGLTSSSKINNHTMKHLQPSCLSDIMELLPGGMAKNPALNTPNTIVLREAGISSNQYNTSALGTSFIVDGAPISTNANLQTMYGAWDTQTTSRDFTNAGVDMRTIATDDIESIEVVRGIPSVEYGELTSGLLKIVRKTGGKDLSARFKADMSSKLFYISKGFEWEQKKSTLNISFDYLNSKSDPRNILENYKRFTSSIRSTKNWNNDSLKFSTSLNFDYGGSFDNDKVDPDLNVGNVDSYSSKYNRFAGAWNFRIESERENNILKKTEMTVSSSYELNRTNRTRLVQISGETPCTITTDEGESFAPLIYPYTYVASHIVDGKPLSIFSKLTSDFYLPFIPLKNNLKTGADWHYDKNKGDGQIYDVLRPLYTGISSRYRPYYDIPSEQTIAVFAEENLTAKLGKNKLDTEIGVRASSMLNLSSDYKMDGEWYADPRIKVGWTFPSFSIFNNKMSIVLTGGYGWHTKFPTIGQLYPETVYIDLVEMNYWHENRDCRGIYTQTYIADATNYNLEPARNKKKEVRIDISCKGNRLSVTFFNEDMKSGFRSMTEYRDYPYKKYDISGIDAATLTSVPDPHTLPYKIVHELNGFSKTCNGSRTHKQGVEYTISTIRMPKTNTRLTINGAYFKTVYENSMEIQEIPNSMVFGDKIHYAGVYNDDDGYIRETNNTNFTFDTDIPSIHLGVSLSAQCVWQTASQSAEKQNTPIAYIDNTGERHEFTDDAVEADPLLKFLIRTYNASLYERQTVPFAMNINMKATKSLINDKLMVALFVYKLLDAHPSYVRNGYEIRRYAKPYFGLEMNLKL